MTSFAKVNNNSPINDFDRLPSPFYLFFVCLVITILIMSFISRPIKLSTCCNCWKTGIPPVWLVCIGLVIVQIGFGIYPVIIKEFADSDKSKANPLILSFYRDLCCFPVLFLCAFIAERKIMIPSLGMLVLFIIMGLIGMFGNQYLFILGVYKAGPNVASVFQPIIPVWTAVLAIFTCIEKPSFQKFPFWSKMFGILLAAGGAIEITLMRQDISSNNNEDSQFQRIIGYLSLFGNTFCMAIYVLLQKRFIFDKVGNKWRDYPVSVTAYSYFFGAIFMGLCSLQYIGTPENRTNYNIPRESVYVLVYATFVTSALCYLLITWANSQVSSILVTAFWPVQVLIAVIGSWLVLGIEFARLQYIGAVMLIVGLFCVLWANYQEEKDKEGRGGYFSKVTLDCGLCGDKECEQPLHGSINRTDISPSPDPSITSQDVNKYINN